MSQDRLFNIDLADLARNLALAAGSPARDMAVAVIAGESVSIFLYDRALGFVRECWEAFAGKKEDAMGGGTHSVLFKLAGFVRARECVNVVTTYYGQLQSSPY